jgi:hypothetical protein
VDVQDRPAVFPGGKDTHPHHLVGAIYRQQYGVWWCFVRTSRANHDLPSSDAADEDHMA